MTSSNIFIMNYVILTFLLEPNQTRDNHQISVESTQFYHIQCIHSKLVIPRHVIEGCVATG